MHSVPERSWGRARSDVRAAGSPLRSESSIRSRSAPNAAEQSFRRALLFEPDERPADHHQVAGAPGWLKAAREGIEEPGDYLAFAADDEAEVVPLEPGWTRVGRSLSADLRFDDPTVSRRHALVYRDPEGGARILDDRSLNGVFLNGERVELAELDDGDEIAVGRFNVFFLRASDPPARGGGRALAHGARLVAPEPPRPCPPYRGHESDSRGRRHARVGGSAGIHGRLGRRGRRARRGHAAAAGSSWAFTRPSAWRCSTWRAARWQRAPPAGRHALPRAADGVRPRGLLPRKPPRARRADVARPGARAACTRRARGPGASSCRGARRGAFWAFGFRYDGRRARASAPREVTPAGRVLFRSRRQPPPGYPMAATADGIVLEHRGRTRIWDPRTGAVRPAPGSWLVAASGDRTAWCGQRCRRLRLEGPGGHAVARQLPRGWSFSPGSGSLSADGSLLAVAAHRERRPFATRIALVRTADGAVELLPAPLPASRGEARLVALRRVALRGRGEPPDRRLPASRPAARDAAGTPGRRRDRAVRRGLSRRAQPQHQPSTRGKPAA